MSTQIPEQTFDESTELLILVTIALFAAIMLNASRKTRSEPRTLDERAAELEIMMRATPFD